MVRVETYLTDFMVLSSLLAGLLPGDSFLLRRNARRFFISLALGDKAIDRQSERERQKGGETGGGDKKNGEKERKRQREKDGGGERGREMD